MIALSQSTRRAAGGAWWLVVWCGVAWLQWATALGNTDPVRAVDITDEYDVQSWSMEEGLPDAAVTALTQSADGYLWIGTRYGCVRFDGVEMVPYTHAQYPQLRSVSVSSMVADSGNGLWMGTSEGLLHWDGTRLLPVDLPGGSTNDDAVGALCLSQAGGIWFVNPRGFFRGQRGQATGPWSLTHPLRQSIEVMAEDSVGRVWFGEDSLRWFDSTGRVSASIPGTQRPVPVYDGFTGLHLGASGHCAMMGVDDRWARLFAFDESGVRPGTETFVPLANRKMRSHLDPRGDFWVSANTNGVYRIRGGQIGLLRVPWRVREDFPLCACTDREGNLWVGTESSGVYRLRPRLLRPFRKPFPPEADNIWALQEGPDGAVWVGSETGLTYLNPPASAGEALQDWLGRGEVPGVRAMTVDAEGQLWGGTLRSLFRWDQQGAEVFRLEGPVAGDPDLAGWNKVRSLKPRRQGGLWVGIPKGLCAFREGRWGLIDSRNGLSGEDVRDVLEAKDGALWLATYGGGVFRLPGPLPDFLNGLEAASSGEHPAPLDTRIGHWPGKLKWQQVSLTNGMASNLAWALHEDAEGVVWVATDRGLHRVDWRGVTDGGVARSAGNASAVRSTPSVFVFTQQQGLIDDDINFVLEDDYGDFWLTSNRGISRVPRSALNQVAAGHAPRVYPVRYNKSDGMPSAETNGTKSHPPAIKTRDGRLWFATTAGVAMADPRVLHEGTLPPLFPLVQQVLVDDEIVLDDRGVGWQTSLEAARQAVESRAKPAGAPLLLAPGRARLVEFRYGASSFVAPQELRFRYRLTGYDQAWHDAGTRRIAYYSNLSPGQYLFEVQGANHHQVWSQQTASVAFRLQPHFFQTWLFRLTMLIVVVGGIYAAVDWRIGEVRRLAGLQRELALERERAHLARNLHDGLGAELHRLSLLADLVEKDRAGETTARQGHLDTFREAVRSISRSLRDTIWTTHAVDESVEAVMARITQTTENLLKPAGLAARFDLPILWPELQMTPAAREALLYVVKEAIHNIVRHAGATEVRIQAEAGDETLRLSIMDDGRGLPADGGRGATPPRNADHGMGLVNMCRRLESLSGKCTVSSEPGRGTKICLELPWKSVAKRA